MRNILLTLCLGLTATPALLAQTPAAPPTQPPTTPPAAPAAPATPPPAAPPETPAAPDAQPQTPPAVPPVPAALPLVGPSGMVFHAIKAEKTADFEAVMTRLRDLLAASSNGVRRQQAAGWRVFKQTTPMADGAALYVSVLDPVVPNAEYDVPRLLAEAAPAEAAQLYEQFRDAHVAPTVQASNLSLVLSLVPAAPAAAPQP